MLCMGDYRLTDLINVLTFPVSFRTILIEEIVAIDEEVKKRLRAKR